MKDEDGQLLTESHFVRKRLTEYFERVTSVKDDIEASHLSVVCGDRKPVI